MKGNKIIKANKLRKVKKEIEELEIKSFLEPIEKRLISATAKGWSSIYYTEESEYKTNIIKQALEEAGYKVSREKPEHPEIKRLCISWE